MDTFMVILIVGLAIFYVGRKFFSNLRKDSQPSCGCGCSACEDRSICTDPEYVEGASFHLK
jgi:FeoB-associated Cys-rich membrane protein